MSKTQIKNRWTGAVLAEGNDDVRDVIVQAVSTGAYLNDAYLTGANLTGADLTGAYLRGAELADANLTGARLPWGSHTLLGEILARAADTDSRRALACLVGYGWRFGWCWDHYLAMDHPDREWALDTLAGCVVDGDGARAALRERAARTRQEAAS